MALSVALTLALAAACSDPVQREPEPPAPEPAEPARPTEHAQQMPTGLASPSALAAALPERLGDLERSGDPAPHVELGVTPTTRVALGYEEGERRATLRVVDAARARDLVAGFAAAQRIGAIDAPGTDELVPTGIAGRPGLASWSPETRTSEAQVLVADRFVVALTLTPAQVPEEAVELLESLPLERLEALAR